MANAADLSRIQAELLGIASAARVDQIDYTYLGTRREDEALVVEGNVHGLLRLAAHLVALAQQKPGSHLHLDDASELTECGQPIILMHVARE